MPGESASATPTSWRLKSLQTSTVIVPFALSGGCGWWLSTAKLMAMPAPPVVSGSSVWLGTLMTRFWRWHVAQPIWLNSVSPWLARFRAWEVAAGTRTGVSR